MSLKRSREEESEAGVAALVAAQELEDEGQVAAAIARYREIVAGFDGAGVDARAVQDAPSPPPAVVASVAANGAASALVEGKPKGAEHDQAVREAEELYRKAIDLWPGNAMALFNLAELERENGKPQKAIDRLKGLVAREETTPEQDWHAVWVCDPEERCMAMASYTLAVLYHLSGKDAEAIPLLQQLGYRYRIAPAIWQKGRGAVANSDSHKLQVSETPVQLWKGAIPDPLRLALQHAFRPDSLYWLGTDYKERGYFSFWYDVSKPASNLAELAIQTMLPRLGRTDIVGAEWWVHSRPSNRNLGHQLHFDTEENHLEMGKVVHPAVSSVTYISGGAASGPTVVFDQGYEADSPAAQAVVAEPEYGSVLLFPGNALHGVLPGALDEEIDKEVHRLTFMVGFWNSSVQETGTRFCLGPCGPFPDVSPEFEWAKELSIPAGLTVVPETILAEKSNVVVAKPAWEELPTKAATDDTFVEPPEIPDDLDRHFFVSNFEDFAAMLLSRDNEADDVDSDGQSRSEEGSEGEYESLDENGNHGEAE